jgi:hypothetical protein
VRPAVSIQIITFAKREESAFLFSHGDVDCSSDDC